MSFDCLKKKAVLLTLVLGAIVYGTYQFMEHRFCLEHICFSEASLNEISSPSGPRPSAEEVALVTAALAQPYAYLDRGKQSYAFISQDRQYVLKFFDLHRMHRRAAAEALYKGKQEENRQKRLHQLIDGYHLAYHHDRKHSGLLFVQLAPSNALEAQLVVSDRLGIRHTIPLKEVPFVIQKLAIPSRLEIHSLLNEGEVAKAKDRFHQLIDMYVTGYRKGVVDADHNIMYNTGFVGQMPIRIDLGRLQLNADYQQVLVYQPDIEKIVFERIDGWLKRHHPPYREEIVNDLKGYLDSVKGRP